MSVMHAMVMKWRMVYGAFAQDISPIFIIAKSNHFIVNISYSLFPDNNRHSLEIMCNELLKGSIKR